MKNKYDEVLDRQMSRRHTNPLNRSKKKKEKKDLIFCTYYSQAAPCGHRTPGMHSSRDDAPVPSFCISQPAVGWSTDQHYYPLNLSRSPPARPSRQRLSWLTKKHNCSFLSYKHETQLSKRDRAAGCVIVFAKSRRLELEDNILRTV